MTKQATARPKPLPSSALRKLRALGHDLSPVVALGKDGLTAAVVAAVDSALTSHELIKVKLQREAPVDRHEAATELAKRTGSALAGVVGRTLLLYRRHPKKPKIDLSAPAANAKKAKPAKGRHVPTDPANAEGSVIGEAGDPDDDPSNDEDEDGDDAELD